MRTPTSRAALACLTALGLWQLTPTAHACGGLFCSRTPVDQSAERVVFTVHEDTTDMVVQITYQGDDESFAWLLPLVNVPDPALLDTVPIASLMALDNNTEPQFTMHPECQAFLSPVAAFGGGGGTTGTGAVQEDSGGVTVYFEQQVGPYVAAAIESDDPAATAKWLRDNQYNISESMDPYIKLYTDEGMKFLALKLTADASVNDIEPFKVTLPGTSPGIPLRLTTLAAEPEMGVKTWIFADQRYEPANAVEVEINNDDLRWEPYSWGSVNNWHSLVARAVDAEGGRAWVAEMAGDPADLRTFVEGSFVADAEQEEAQQALLTMIGDSAYMTRLYTRLAPEEMTYDPVFSRSTKGDVDRVRELPYVEELCGDTVEMPPPPRCDFAACGSLGLCREVMDPTTEQLVAACACAPGATARTTRDVDGSTVMVSCQDQRLSFINPGDALLPDNGRLPDPCVDFDCGEHGSCVSMNLTPTCECEQGYVARGAISPDGVRSTTCVMPEKAIPEVFYELRPEDRPEDLPVGRDVDLPEREVTTDNGEVMDMLAGMGENVAPGGGTGGTTGSPASASSSGGCTSGGPGAPTAGWLALLLGTALFWRRGMRA